MFRIIPRPVHAGTDYLYVAALAASPSIAGFEDGENATFVARALAGTTVLASLLTRYELNLIPLIPFNMKREGRVGLKQFPVEVRVEKL